MLIKATEEQKEKYKEHIGLIGKNCSSTGNTKECIYKALLDITNIDIIHHNDCDEVTLEDSTGVKVTVYCKQ